MQVEKLNAFLRRRPPKVGPKQLHGVKEAKMLLVQSSDGRGETMVNVMLEADGKCYAFPSNTWDSLGVPNQWLEQQLEDARHPFKAMIRRPLLRLLKAIT